MPRNARRELDKLLLEIALSEGTLVQRVLIGMVSLLFIQLDEVPKHLQDNLLALQNLCAKRGSLATDDAKLFVIQLVHLRNQLIEEQESTRLASFRTTA
jgi:hypothetical protein